MKQTIGAACCVAITLSLTAPAQARAEGISTALQVMSLVSTSLTVAEKIRKRQKELEALEAKEAKQREKDLKERRILRVPANSQVVVMPRNAQTGDIVAARRQVITIPNAITSTKSAPAAAPAAKAQRGLPTVHCNASGKCVTTYQDQ